MAVKVRYIALTLILLIVAAASFFLLLMSTSMPVYSVKEIIEEPNAESYIGQRIQLVGNVIAFNDSGFFLNDPENKSDYTYLVYVQAGNAEKPAGFALNKTVLVEGKLIEFLKDKTVKINEDLISVEDLGIFKAAKISTKCPSKYQSES